MQDAAIFENLGFCQVIPPLFVSSVPQNKIADLGKILNGVQVGLVRVGTCCFWVLGESDPEADPGLRVSALYVIALLAGIGLEGGGQGAGRLGGRDRISLRCLGFRGGS